MMKPLPRSVQALLDRTLLARFTVTPPPASLGDSLQVYTYISEHMGERGRVIHYLQEMCPVTKKRLEKLQVLMEDLSRKEEFPKIHERLSGEIHELTPLESSLFDAFREPASVGESSVKIRYATRNQDEILRIANDVKSEE